MNKLLFSIISLFTIILMIIESRHNINFSSRVFFTNIFIQIYSLYNIFNRRNEPYSLNKILYLFSFFFFGIAPLLQFFNNTKIWYSRPLLEYEYFYTNVLIIFILLLYESAYTIFKKIKISPKQKLKIENLTISHKYNSRINYFLIVISMLSFFIVFQYNNYSLLSMLFRGGEFSKNTEGLSFVGQIVSNFIRPLSMMCLLYYIMLPHKNYFVSIILVILTLLTCSPTGMARYAVAGLYIPVILLAFPFIRKENIFSIFFILSLLIVFPFLDNFRYFAPNSKIQIGFNFQMFLEGHFDSYQNFALIVSKNIISYGKQLLGVLLFWVPRILWPDKPIGSGAYLAKELKMFFDNISANYFAEGYINFGFAGIIIFTILLSYWTARIDKIYWNMAILIPNNYFTVIYMITLGMLFFILRGDLLSSFAYTFGFIFSALFLFKILNKKFK